MEFFTKIDDRAAEQISGGAGIGRQVSRVIRFNREELAPEAGFQNPNKLFKSGKMRVAFPGGETFANGRSGPNNNNRSGDTFGEGVANAIAVLRP